MLNPRDTRRRGKFRGVLFVALIALLVVLSVNAALHSSRQHFAPLKPTAVPGEAGERLASVIRFATVSPSADEDGEPFLAMHAYLRGAFPKTFENLEVNYVNDLTLHLIWQGQNSNLGHIVFLAHQDVVPVPGDEVEAWSYPPFSGEIADGTIWGRGALDNKHNLMGMLEAIEHHLTYGFMPSRTLHFVFGHDEETGGHNGAKVVAEKLKKQNVKVDAVFDEGLVIADGIVPGVDGRVALIGVSEKGYLTVRMTIRGTAGHSSMPPGDSTPLIVAEVLQRLDAKPMYAAIDGPAKLMFDYLAAEMAWPYRLLFANQWLFGPLLRWQMQAKPSTNALVRTTSAPTIIHAGNTENVIPHLATMTVNIRIHPRDSIDGVLQYLQDQMNGLDVEFWYNPDVASEPGKIADVDSPWFRALQRSIAEVFPETLVAPGLMLGYTDSRHFGELTSNIYRFQPVVMTQEELKLFHGVDERISQDAYHQVIGYYTRLIENLQQPSTWRTAD